MLKILDQFVNKLATHNSFRILNVVVHRAYTYSINCSTPKAILPATNSSIYQSVRYYAKTKDKKKDKGKSKVEVSETQLAEIINLDSLKKQMDKALTILKEDYVKHLSLRSTTGSIESIPVNLDGKEHTLQELAQVIRKNPKLIVINMAVFPQAIPAVLKAIACSGMNLNPQQDGTTLYIPVPVVTREHRENLAKNAKTLFTKCKDSIRDAQNKQFKILKRKEGISIDLTRNVEQQIVAIADTYINEGEKIMISKHQELIGKQ